MWLLNPDWKLLPIIAFVDGYPRVLTCKYHGGGFNLITINCCICRTNIPSHVSDQVCHTVVKPQYNSTGCQMVEQQISWNDPDTINVSIVGKIDHGSILIQ